MDIIRDFLLINDYSIVDIETTGLNCRCDDIIEISALNIVGDEIVGSFSQLVHTDLEISGFITNLTGIDNTMLKNADNISSVLCLLFDFIGDNTIVGHNICFDMRFLSWQSQLNFGEIPYNKTLDSLKLARALLKDLNCHKLSYLKNYFGISGSSHRALDDCRTTFELIRILKELALNK